MHTNEQLTPEQARRVSALRAARSVVGMDTRPGEIPSGLDDEGTRRTVVLAQYVLTGNHPALTTEGN